MTNNGWLQIIFFLLVVLALTKPLGAFMTRVFNREKTFLDPILRPLEKVLYRLTGVEEATEMGWKEYACSVLLFSGVTMALTYLIERVQNHLPLNPQKLAAVAPDLAFNTAASFTTNTNWQAYVPETTMSYLTQMTALAYHNFISAAVGIALAIAVVRGIARREKDTIGNFWVDMTRATLWVLLPACIVSALFLVSQGVVQNFKPYTTVELVDPQTVQTTGSDGKTTTQVVHEQTIAQGPTASQEAIKELGTNGGGFFNANSAHPFENPTPLTNFFELVLIFAIGSGLTYTLGQMTGSPRHGWAVWCAMAILFLVGVAAAYSAEARGNPLLASPGSHIQTTAGNMEGKEVRFGIANSALWAVVTTDTTLCTIPTHRSEE
jgi:potassium-transporting ATPase potassium-binding subunit